MSERIHSLVSTRSGSEPSQLFLSNLPNADVFGLPTLRRNSTWKRSADYPLSRWDVLWLFQKYPYFDNLRVEGPGFFL